METTVNLDLPYIMPSQAQKHVTHNEALELLDAIVQLAVLDRDLVLPPAAPDEAARYIVATDGQGAWQGQDGKIAIWRDGGWRFLSPQPGWLAWVIKDANLVQWTGSDWQLAANAASLLQNLTLLGIGTMADNENPFAAKLNKALWAARTTAEGGDGDLRYTMNKQATGNVLSLLMQSNWSGRAEIGLVGNDDLAVRVSGDGTDWKEAITVDSQSGKVAFPQTRMLSDFAISLLPDSGRFAGNAAKAITIGAFAFPSYFSFLNDTTAGDGGKFIYNNNDYGGTAGALPASIRALIDMIRSPAHRRYGNEFRIAELTMGAGTSIPVTVDGKTYHQSLSLAFGPRPMALTFHAYICALDAPVLWVSGGQTMIRNGVAMQGHQLISPDDGWVSMAVQDTLSPYYNVGYSPTPFTINAHAQGNRYLVACPALMPGITSVDVNAGIVAGINRWLP